MKKITLVFLISLILAIMLVTGCCKKIWHDPVMQLDGLEPIGLINFTSNAEGGIEKMATEKVVQYMREDQTSIRILELGDMKDVLDAIGEEELNFEAVKKIEDKYNCRTVLTGDLYVSDVKPNLDISFSFPYVAASADVKMTLKVKLYETQTGASVWSSSAWKKQELGQIKIFKDNIRFNADNPEDAYGEIIRDIAWHVTRDFRYTYTCE